MCRLPKLCDLLAFILRPFAKKDFEIIPPAVKNTVYINNIFLCAVKGKITVADEKTIISTILVTCGQRHSHLGEIGEFVNSVLNLTYNVSRCCRTFQFLGDIIAYLFQIPECRGRVADFSHGTVLPIASALH